MSKMDKKAAQAILDRAQKRADELTPAQAQQAKLNFDKRKRAAQPYRGDPMFAPSKSGPGSF